MQSMSPSAATIARGSESCAQTETLAGKGMQDNNSIGGGE